MMQVIYIDRFGDREMMECANMEKVEEFRALLLKKNWGWIEDVVTPGAMPDYFHLYIDDPYRTPCN